MKIQNKAAILIFVMGAVIVVLLSLGYDAQSHNVVIEKELKNIKNLSEEIALHVDSNLREKIAIGITLSSAPLIKDVLLKSNSGFALFSDEEREQEIDRRNRKWIDTSALSDPFIQDHMTNSAAEYFKVLQTNMPEEYGEVFLTNRYGVMVATTGKLTTLAHAHKYWWLASYNESDGRIFLDDRGFDTSVQGYVLGVVVPIKEENEIIGILKCNVNIMGPLTDVVQDFYSRKVGRLRIVRTGGLVVSEYGITPLSTLVSEDLIERLGAKESGTGTISENNVNQLIAYSPIKITMGSEQFGFGGKQESMDHIQGNLGEAWQVVVTLSEDIALETAHQTSKLIITVGIIITLIAAVVALFLGRLIASPIIDLAAIAHTLGEGHLSTRISVQSKDEIGSLGVSLNKMAENLQETMTSRDELISINKELQNALTEIKTLSGLLPICAHCKKVRDEKGYWKQIESYIESHTDALFSHGLCEECAKELYGDKPWYKQKKEKE